MAFYGLGSGTALDPYQIMDLSQLQQITTYYNKYFILMADIELGDNFSPLCQSTAFTGTLDGNGYLIKNGVILGVMLTYTGLFGKIGSCTIKNIIMDNVTVWGNDQTSAGSSYVGMIAGFSNGSPTISDCWIKSTCYASSAGTARDIYVGGFIGFSRSYSGDTTKLSRCLNEAPIYGGNNAGGMIGEHYGYGNTSTLSYLRIENCKNTGGITAGVSFNTKIGGIIGYCYLQGGYSYPRGYITNCINTGNIDAKTVAEGRAGGIMGDANNSYCNISNCYALNTSIEATYDHNRISPYSYATFSNNFALDTMVSGPFNYKTGNGKDGADLTAANSMLQASYTTFDFDTIWWIFDGTTIPQLKIVPEPFLGSRMLIDGVTVPLYITSLKDNNNISFTENKTNSTSTKSYMIFNGNKRRKITISAYTTYANYELLRAAAENYSRCITELYPPKDEIDNITPSSYYYISNLKVDYKLGDDINTYFTMELTFGGESS